MLIVETIGRIRRALAAQLLHAGADGRKVVGGARSGHLSSDFLLILN
jgi:hypothetical protein